MSRATVFVALALVTAAAVSCHSTMLPGERYYINRPGIGVAYLPRNPAEVRVAALEALREDLGYTIESEDPLVARTDRDRTIRITLSDAARSETKMQISMLADTPAIVIREMMSKIEARLQ